MSLRHDGVLRLGYVRIALGAADPAAVRRFYTEVLGLIEEAGGDRRLYLRCWHEAFPYSLVIDLDAPAGLVEVGLQVRDDAALERAGERASAAGARVQREAAGALAGMGPSTRVLAPGGLVLRLYAELPQVGYVVGFDSPHWVTPRALRATPAPLFLNHVGVTVDDVEAAVGFLTGALDFAVSERLEDSADGALVSALAFRMSKEVGGQEIALYRGPAGRLHHVAFTREDPGDLLIDGQYLGEAGVVSEPYGPTWQSYGRTFSLHFRDPFGVRLELCAGGRNLPCHPGLQPVVWDTGELARALSWYDGTLDAGFLEPCL